MGRSVGDGARDRAALQQPCVELLVFCFTQEDRGGFSEPHAFLVELRRVVEAAFEIRSEAEHEFPAREILQFVFAKRIGVGCLDGGVGRFGFVGRHCDATQFAVRGGARHGARDRVAPGQFRADHHFRVFRHREPLGGRRAELFFVVLNGIARAGWGNELDGVFACGDRGAVVAAATGFEFVKFVVFAAGVVVEHFDVFNPSVRRRAGDFAGDFALSGQRGRRGEEQHSAGQQRGASTAASKLSPGTHRRSVTQSAPQRARGSRVGPAPARPRGAYTGTTPWRFHGRSTCLPSAISSPRQIVARVSRGSMTSSIRSLPAAM